MKNILTICIRGYRSLSSWLRLVQVPGVVYTPCKFHPSCSEYAELAIQKYGPIQGITKACTRILRCNPAVAGGVDYP